MKKKKSEIANQIDTLMRVKSLGQVGLAREIDVSPSRISEWLAGKRSPSSDALWKLGKLAPFPQNLWFWEQAGLTRDAIVSATAKIVDGRRAFVGEVQAIPRFRETPEGMQEDGPPVGLSTAYISDPLSTVWLVVNRELACGPFKFGDIIMLEKDSGDASEERFHGPLVLAEFPVERAGHRLFALQGRAIGTLIKRKDDLSSIPMLEFAPLKGESNTYIMIGRLFSSDLRAGSEGKRLAPSAALEDAELRRVRIVGTVTGWLAGMPHPEKGPGER